MRTLLEIKQSDFDSWCRQNSTWGDLKCVMRVNNEAVYGIESVMCEIPPCENWGNSPLLHIVPEITLTLSAVIMTANVTFYGESGFRGTVSVGVRFYRDSTIIKDKNNIDLFSFTRTFTDGGLRNDVLKYVVSGTKLTVYVNDVHFLTTELTIPPTHAKIFITVSSQEGLLGVGGVRYLRIDYEDPLGEVMDLIMSMLPLFMLFFVMMLFFRMFSGFAKV